ncbi:MAG TPA: CheR family methyltransferase, partial [Candidatus Eisenbacteria bacterium]
DHESALTQILSRATSLPVTEITNAEPVQANHVYIIPRDTNLSIAGGVLKLEQRPRSRAPHRPIDAFFESLSQDRRERAVGVVLSGTASDGTLGLEAIKAEGGITFAQDESAKYDSMPQSAIAAGCVDLVLSPAEIAKEIARIAKHPYVRGKQGPNPAGDEGEVVETQEEELAPPEIGEPGAAPAIGPAEGGSTGFNRILYLLRSHSGVDFSLYKPTTIHRRVTRRLVLNRQNSFDDYATFLQDNATELDALYSDVLISVTSFFRNPESFEALQNEILPLLLKSRRNEPVRCWIVGCSTGQEAYSIAIAFAEVAERTSQPYKLQIFATDLNEALLEKARQGLYPRSLAEDMGPQRLRRFFVEEESGYRVHKSLREMVVFARQNLITDPPFSRLDLISCRNVLIYLEPSMQKRAISTFHHALRPGGFLFLGASESIAGFTDLFEQLDKKHKIYSKKASSRPAMFGADRNVRAVVPRGPRTPLPSREPGEGELQNVPRGERNAEREADRIVVSKFAPPGVVVDGDLQILQFRGSTGGFLEPSTGKATFDVLKMARDGLMLPLRSAIDQAKQEGRPARRENIRVKRDGDDGTVNVEVIPLKNLRELCFLVLFEDVEQAADGSGPARTKRAPVRRPPVSDDPSRIGELEIELAETRAYLQSMQEQHETANEELQAANEEVQSANEELQSINEELETSKEELESSNEELTTVNEEMSNRNIELNRLNTDLVNLQTSTKLAILLLGRDLAIRRFSPRAEKMFDLAAADVGRPIGQIRHNLFLGEDADFPVNLESLGAEVIASALEQEREVRDTNGRWHSLRVRPYLTSDNRVDGAVMVLVDIDTLKRSERAVIESEARYGAMFESTGVGVCEADPATGRLVRVNEQFVRTAGYSRPELTGKTFLELTHPEDQPKYEVGISQLSRGEIPFFEIEMRLVRKDGTIVWVNVTFNLVQDAAHRPLRTVAIALDITERKRAEAAARVSEERLQFTLDATKIGQWDLDIETDTATRSLRHDQIYGYDSLQPEWGYRKFLEKHVHPDDQAFVDEVFHRSLAEGKQLVFECRILRADRTMRWIWVVGTVYLRHDGKPQRMAGLVMDVTERKRLETDLRRYGVELAQADHRKNEFLAMLGHELRNPLSALAHGLDLLGKVSDDRARAEELRGMMVRQANRIGSLLDQLLDIARVISGKVDLTKERVDLVTVIQEAVETVKSLPSTMERTLTLSLPPPRAVFAMGDSVRLTQVVENLLTNAVKYTNPGGHLSLTLDADEAGARIAVQDDGIGIDAEFLPHVFEVFTQAPQLLDRAESGLGLGLPLVKRLVEMHGGQVEARSRGLGKGSEFVVTLPRALERRSKQRLEGKQTRSSSARIHPRRILIVDDEEDTAEGIAALLELEGHQTRAVFDGHTALEAVRTFDAEVVLLDLGLPEIDGYEVARRIREVLGSKRVLLVAVSGYESDKDRLQHAGFDRHLLKPLNMQKLSALLTAWESDGPWDGGSRP